MKGLVITRIEVDSIKAQWDAEREASRNFWSGDQWAPEQRISAKLSRAKAFLASRAKDHPEWVVRKLSCKYGIDCCNYAQCQKEEFKFCVGTPP